MTFDQLYDQRNVMQDAIVELTGWIVLMNQALYLIEENYQPDYKLCKKVEISNRDIAYVLETVVSPLADFESFLFHEAKIRGKLISANNNLIIEPTKIYVEAWDKKLVKVDISNGNIEKSKFNKSDIFDTTRNIGNWFDV